MLANTMNVIAILYTVKSKRRDFKIRIIRRQNCATVAAAREWLASIKSNIPETREEILPASPELESNAGIEGLLQSKNRGRWHKGKRLLSPQ